MSRRDQVRMNDEEIHAFLAQSLIIIVNTIGRDGVPHPMPMWYAVEDDGAIVMTTFTKSQKIQNLKRDPRVTLLLEDGTVYAELRGVIFHGTVELEEDVDAVVAILGAIGRRDSGDAAGAADALSEAEQAGVRAQARKRTAIRLRPTKVVSWDHRKLGGVY